MEEPPIEISVRPVVDDDLAWKERALRSAWRSTAVARLGELIDPMALDGFVATAGGSRAGLLTYSHRGIDLEVVTIQVERSGLGIGRSLMDAVDAHAEQLGARRLWLVTTNNNFRALAFYQRWGMDMAAFHRNGVATSRVAKPSIPEADPDGVAIRHEIELERWLVAPQAE